MIGRYANRLGYITIGMPKKVFLYRYKPLRWFCLFWTAILFQHFETTCFSYIHVIHPMLYILCLHYLYNL